MQIRKNNFSISASAGFFTGIAIYYAVSKFPGLNISSGYIAVFGIITSLIFLLFSLIAEKYIFLKNKGASRLITVSSFFALPFIVFSLIYGGKLSLIKFSMLGNISFFKTGFVSLNMDSYSALLSAGAAVIFPLFVFMLMLAKEAADSSAFSAKFIFISVFIFGLISGIYNTFIYPPTGDEPHYLLMAQSLVKDHDMNLENDYVFEKTYRNFYPSELEYKNIHNTAGKNGKGIYSIHNPGISLLISIPYMIAGRYGAQFLIAFFAAILAVLIFKASISSGSDEKTAAASAIITSVIIPFSAGASLILTEMPSACAVVYCAFFIRDIFRGEKKEIKSDIIFFICTGFLVWLHPKMFVFSGIFWAAWIIAVIVKKRFNAKEAIFLNIIFFVFISLYIIYYYSIFGFFAFTGMKNIYVSSSFFFDFNLFHIIKAFFAIFFDRDYGLFFFSPVFILSFTGVIFMTAKKEHIELLPFYFTIPYFCLFLVWNDWTGSMAPARQLIPAACVWAVYAAVFISKNNLQKNNTVKITVLFSVFFSAILSILPFLRYAASKDKIYSLISTKAGYLLWLFPTYRDKITPQTIIITVFYALLAGYIIYKFLKIRSLK